MSSLTIEEKLSMIQKMQSHASTQTKFPENIHARPRPVNTELSQEDSYEEFHSLRLRLFVCILIFSAFFGLYKMKIEIRGHDVTEVNSLLETNQLPRHAVDSLESLSQQLVDAVKNGYK